MFTLLFLLYWLLSIASWAYALRFGGKSAWWAFVLFVLAMAGTVISTDREHPQNLQTWSQINVPLLITDSLYFLGLYVLALRSRKYWTIWSAGLQLLCVISHFGPLIDPVPRPKLYRGLEAFWMLPMLVTMVAGISLDRLHERRPVGR
jgi:hypothetical protein